jgi:hypothetical protein
MCPSKLILLSRTLFLYQKSIGRYALVLSSFFVMQAWLATISLALCKVSLLWREMFHKANGVLFLHLSNYCAYTRNI